MQQEDNNRDLVIAGKSNSRGVHNFQIASQNFGKSQPSIALGVRVCLWVVRVYAVNLRCLQDGIAPKFSRPQRCGCVRRKERIASTTRKDRNAAGIEIGMRMRKGIIAVKGPVRDFAGLQMKGGTIVLMSGAEIRTGAWMMRGTIVSLKPVKLLPTFSYACRYNPTLLRLYAKYLKPLGFAVPCEEEAGAYQRYTGDSSVPGKGEILVWQGNEG